MDPMTMGAIVGGGLGLASTLSGNSAAKKQAKAYQDAINLMREQMAREYSGLYGATSTADSMSTGDPYQDHMLREIARLAQEREIQAANINLASKNMTDRDAQNAVLMQMIRQNADSNNAALANSSRELRNTGAGNAGALLWQANRDRARGAGNAYNQSRMATNDNLQRIGQGANLNTGSVADQNRQQAQNLYQNANTNYQAAANTLAGLMTSRNQAKARNSGWLGALGSGAVGAGLGAGLGYGYQQGWFK